MNIWQGGSSGRRTDPLLCAPLFPAQNSPPRQLLQDGPRTGPSMVGCGCVLSQLPVSPSGTPPWESPSALHAAVAAPLHHRLGSRISLCLPDAGPHMCCTVSARTSRAIGGGSRIGHTPRFLDRCLSNCGCIMSRARATVDLGRGGRPASESSLAHALETLNHLEGYATSTSLRAGDTAALNARIVGVCSCLSVALTAQSGLSCPARWRPLTGWARCRHPTPSKAQSRPRLFWAAVCG